MTMTVAIALTIGVMLLIRLSTGPFLYHIMKGLFWIAIAYSTDYWPWAFLAGWDMGWLLIWLERDPNGLKRR